MRLSEIIAALQPANVTERSGSWFAGVVNGRDVLLPYFQEGWVNLADSQYTQGSPLAIAANVKTQITVNGLGAATNQEYADGLHPDVWSDSKFKPYKRGETYNVRLTFTASQATSGSGHYITVDADIGTDVTPQLAASQSIPLVKGQGIPTLVTVAFPFFCLDTFGRNGARLFITPSVDITAWGFALFIQRTFTP